MKMPCQLFGRTWRPHKESDKGQVLTKTDYRKSCHLSEAARASLPESRAAPSSGPGACPQLPLCLRQASSPMLQTPGNEPNMPCQPVPRPPPYMSQILRLLHTVTPISFPSVQCLYLCFHPLAHGGARHKVESSHRGNLESCVSFPLLVS
jgi:hypothetical protein